MKTALFFLLPIFVLVSCGEKKSSTSSYSKEMKTQDVNYNVDGKNYKSFVAYNDDTDAQKPVVMVLPEWWGLTDYAKDRAKKLAELGYFAIAVDFYGDGKTVETPDEAKALATPFYEIPVNTKRIFDAAKAQILNFPAANYDKIAVIGYCFGGAHALNMARQERDLKGAVSFHGNLKSGVKPKNNVVPILVCNGEADSFVSPEEIQAFKKEMDSAKINYTFINYPNALHSFTNPASTEVGKKFGMKVAYNKAADEKSWEDMKQFLTKVFK